MSDKADLEAKIIEAIYRGSCAPSEFQRALELIAVYFDSPGVVLAQLDSARPESQILVGAGAVNDEFFARYQPFAEYDPAPQAFAALAVGTASHTNRFFSETERRKNVFLNEFLRPQGIEATLGSPLLSDQGRFALIGVFQTGTAPGDDDIMRLERLTPHLARALQIRRLFLQSEARGSALESIVNRNETAMIGLQGEGPALIVNDAARAIGAARDGITLDRLGRLIVVDRLAAMRLSALKEDVLHGGAGGLVRIPRPSGHRSYVILVSPLPGGNDLFQSSQDGVLFAIHDPAETKVPTEKRMAGLLQISLSSAKVLQAILEGIELKDYADRAGISMNTVRFHLKSAFAATSARSQAELVRMAMSALGRLGPYFL